jgi:hypothetical protein
VVQIEQRNSNRTRTGAHVLLKTRGWLLCGLLLCVTTCLAEPLPSQLQGSWHITRLVPTTNQGCWNADRAQFLVGTTLTYTPKSMHWQGGDVPLTGVVTRLVDDNDIKAEFSGDSHPADFAQLQIKPSSVLEVNLQHEDADITGASTEVPGDSVLIAAPNRIVGSACGVYFEATRVPAPHHPAHR